MSANSTNTTVKRKNAGRPNRGGGQKQREAKSANPPASRGRGGLDHGARGGGADGGGGRGGGSGRGRGGGDRGGGGGDRGGGRGRGGGDRGGGSGRGGGDRGGGSGRGGGDRGGGRRGRGAGGGGGGRGGGGGGCISRKGGSHLWDDEDDFVLEPRDDFHSDEEEKNPEAPKEVLKVEMQRLHLSAENQEIIEAALLKARGNNFRLKNSLQYRDTRRKLDNAYWIKDNQLLVRGIEDFSIKQDPDKEKMDADFSWANQKLLSLGFHRTRCEAALSECEGDVGMAIENMMTEAFHIKVRKDQSQQLNEEEIKRYEDEKNDEKMALESIYEKAFTEKIPGRVWELQLPLDHLWKYLPSRQEKKKEITDLKNDKGVCQFFLSGYCKFGRRCYRRHVNVGKEQKVEDGHLTGEKEEKVFFLEVRFPAGGKYPCQPCIASIYTNNSKFPREVCMKLTSRLMSEAVSLAKDGHPAVFAMVNILDNESVVDRIASGPVSELSLPKVGVDVNPTNDSNSTDIKTNLSTKYGGRGDNAPRDKKIVNYDKLSDDNMKIRKRWRQLKSEREDEPMMKIRRELPAYNMKDTILNAINSSQVLVISGMTGCGKSTQVPQFILEEWLDGAENHCNILCTQPRRISAIGLATRVAQEKCEPVGGLVGYNIRLETKTSFKTRLLYCTTGILLRRLESDPLLSDVTHIIVDEVHERSEESDFLLMILRDTLPKRPDLRIVLMSATVNADLFSSYFDRCRVLDIPGRTFPVQRIYLEEILDVSGYTMEDNSPYARRSGKPERSGWMDKDLDNDPYFDESEVELLLHDNNFRPAKIEVPDEKCTRKQVFHRYRIEMNRSENVSRTLATMDCDLKINYELIERLVLLIADGGNRRIRLPQEGSILIFMPGLAEITTLHEALANHPRIGGAKKTKDGSRYRLVPLHSSLSSEEQAAVFARTPPDVRKIVIATNLAETSITIDDCVFVIDTALMKENRYDPAKSMESLDTVWASRANCSQRAGRAGRVRPGYCFTLITTYRYEYHIRNDPVPEIQRVPLERLVLRIKILPCFANQTLESVLNGVLEPPAKDAIESAVERLQGVGAICRKGKLTPLGYHLAQLPVDVRVGKLMILGAVFCCLDSALTIAAALAYRSPFLSPFKEREQANKARGKFALTPSDQLATLRAYRAWQQTAATGQQAGYLFAQDNYLSQKTLQTIATMKHQFVELLASIDFVPGKIRMQLLDRAARGKGGGDALLAVTDPKLNVNNDNTRVVSAVICAALYPNIVKVLTPEAKYKQTAAGAMAKPNRVEDLKFKTKSDGYVRLHPGSVCANVASYEAPYLVYHEKVKTSRVFLREVSMVPMISMVLLGGTGIELNRERGEFVISLEQGWIKFVCDTHKIGELLKEIRLELELILEEKISCPTMDLLTDSRGSAVISAITKALAS